MLDTAAFLAELNDRGFVVVPEMLDADYCRRAAGELARAVAAEDAYHGNAQHHDHGMVLVCARYGGAFLELLGLASAMEPFEAALGSGCIVYAYTSSSMPPSASNYSGRVHVDCPRLIPGYLSTMGGLFMLDEFTKDNGATWVLPGSHTRADLPSDDEFSAGAIQVIAPAGSAVFFNARLVHRGGINRTSAWRHALTISMVRPWMKQRLDLPRLLKDLDFIGQPARVRQKLGFLARVPESYEEYYAPAHLRPYQQPTE